MTRARRALVALLPLALAWVLCPPARGAEPLSSWKKTVAKQCASEARKHMGKKCFLTARAVVDLAKSFVPADRTIQKLDSELSFAPPVPLKAVAAGCRPETIPGTPEMTRAGHKPVEDAAALLAFWKTDRDRMLVSWMKGLQRQGRRKGNQNLAGTMANIIRSLSRQTPMGWDRKAHDLADTFLKKLGYGRDAQGRPLSPDMMAFLEKRNAVAAERLKTLAAEVKVETVSGPSAFEDNLGIELSKYRSDHFRIEGAFDAKGAALALAFLEKTYARFVEKLKLADKGRFESDPLLVVVLPGHQEFCVYIDMMTEESPARRDFLKKSTGAHPVPHKGLYVVYDRLLAQGTTMADPKMLPLRDKMVVLAVENIAYRYGFYWLPQWVRFGLGSWFSLDVLGTAETGRISMQETTGIEQTEWYNYLRWKELMKRAVDRGADPGTGSLLARDNANEINWTHRAKMWSVADWFVEDQTGGFKSFLRFVGADWKSWKRSGNGEFAPLEKAGYTMAKLDRLWRAYVKSRYGG